MIVSIDAEKSFDKIQHSLMITIFNKLEIEENCPNLIYGFYKKPTIIIPIGKN